MEKKREAEESKREADEAKREAMEKKREAEESKREAKENKEKSERSVLARKALTKNIVKLRTNVADLEFVRAGKNNAVKKVWKDWVEDQQKQGKLAWSGTTNITGVKMPISTFKDLSIRQILDTSRALRVEPIINIYNEIRDDVIGKTPIVKNRKVSDSKTIIKKANAEERVPLSNPITEDLKKPEAEPLMPGELGYEPNPEITFHDDDDGVVPLSDDEAGVMRGRGAITMLNSIFGSGRPDILSNFQLDFLMKVHPEYRGTISRDEIHTLWSSRTSPHGSTLPQNEKSCWIMNTDPSNMPGKHWVAVYLDPIDELTTEYYNSSGEACPDDIFQDIQKAVDSLKLPMKLRFKDNRIQNQDDSNNCGWFCMYFLKPRLAGKSWKFCTGYTDLTENLIENWKNNLKIPEKFRDI